MSAAETLPKPPEQSPAQEHHRITIIGAGFAGLGAAIRLEQEGITDYVVLERADDVGGVWRDNSYPGCACDVPSHLYSFSFAPNPDWSRHYSPQPEIWAYLRRVATEHHVLDRVRYRHDVHTTRWSEADGRWTIETSHGSFSSDLLIAANGALSAPAIPSLPGLETFAGVSFHSAQWRHDHDLTGRKVAVVGTGASAIQFVPAIQPTVGHLTLFQRTPPWLMPRGDGPISDKRKTWFRRFPPTRLLQRALIRYGLEVRVFAFVLRPQILKFAQRAAVAHLHKQVADRELRRKLRPNYTLGCKRILLADDYYPALTQPNVDVVTEGIAEVRPHSIVTTDGAEHEVDTIIFGTGFHVTDPPMADVVHGSNGRSLAQAWAGGLEAYLGTTIAGFPNFFLMTGPNTGLGHTSMVLMMEAQYAYLLDCLRHMDAHHVRSVDVRPEVQTSYNAELQERLDKTIWHVGGCRSWYLDPRNGRNTTLWPGSTLEYARRLRHFDASDYTVTRAQTPEATWEIPTPPLVSAP